MDTTVACIDVRRIEAMKRLSTEEWCFWKHGGWEDSWESTDSQGRSNRTHWKINLGFLKKQVYYLVFSLTPCREQLIRKRLWAAGVDQSREGCIEGWMLLLSGSWDVEMGNSGMNRWHEKSLCMHLQGSWVCQKSGMTGSELNDPENICVEHDLSSKRQFSLKMLNLVLDTITKK